MGVGVGGTLASSRTRVITTEASSSESREEL